MFEQGEAEGVEGLALVQFPARPLQRPRRGGKAAEPVEEQRLPAQRLAALAQQRQGRVQQPLVRRLAPARQAQPRQKRRPQLADIGRTEAVQGLGQGLRRRHRLQRPAQLRQGPEHRLRLAREGIQAGAVEIGGGEAGLIVRQEPPRPVVEALARDVQIVGIQHAVNKARRDPPRRQPRRGLDHGAQEAGHVAGRHGRVVERPGMLHQGLHHVGPFQIRRPLKGPEPDVAVRQPHQHRRPGRGRLIAPLQRLAGLDQGQGPAGRHALRLQHGRRQHLAHPALQRQPPVPRPRPGGLAGALGAQVEKSGLPLPLGEGDFAREAVRSIGCEIG